MDEMHMQKERLLADTADQTQLINTLLMRAEDARLLGSLCARTLAAHYLRL